MSNAALVELFRYNTWCTLRLIDACERLTDAQLDATATGTFGSIRHTFLHLLRNENWQASLILGQSPGPRLEYDPFPGFDALRAAAKLSGSAFVEIAGNLQADTIIRGVNEEGEPYELPIMVPIMLALFHAAEHRTHIATIMGAQGIEPPSSDGWEYGDQVLQPRNK